MTDAYAARDHEDTPLIETASGTTSPTNSKSGNFAFIVAVVTLVGCFFFGLGMSGIIKMVSKAMEQSEGSYTYTYTYNDGDLDHVIEQWEEHQNPKRRG